MQLYHYFMSQSSEFCRHNPLCCFSTSVYCCYCLFRYDSVAQFAILHVSGLTLSEFNVVSCKCVRVCPAGVKFATILLCVWMARSAISSFLALQKDVHVRTRGSRALCLSRCLNTTNLTHHLVWRKSTLQIVEDWFVLFKSWQDVWVIHYPHPSTWPWTTSMRMKIGFYHALQLIRLNQ
jgi:hypothetical protein